MGDFNESTVNETIIDRESLTNDDAAWILSCGFLIFTMQTGFAMLESGAVSAKNATNIMIKNVVDVSIGGLGYWIFGYALSFGQLGNSFMRYSSFFFRETEESAEVLGSNFGHYFFQLSFATTATTIVSGAAAERMTLRAYIVFSFFNNIIYCIPAAWCWRTTGFLHQLGFYDFAGVGIVHVCGGATALTAALMLGPRTGRYTDPDQFKMSSPVTSLTGMFMLWWAWLGFNCGSTMGMIGEKWKLTVIVAVVTLNAAAAGGSFGIIISMFTYRGKVSVEFVILSVLGGLVSITGILLTCICVFNSRLHKGIASITSTVEAVFIGCGGAVISIGATRLMDKLHIDDPVSACAVHLFAGSWGVLCIGLFGNGNKRFKLDKFVGAFHGGGLQQLGIQAIGLICILTWSISCSFLLLLIIKKTMGIRLNISEEILGADFTEHNIRSKSQELESVIHSTTHEALKKLVHEIVNEGKPRFGRNIRATRHQRIFSTNVVGIHRDINDTDGVNCDMDYQPEQSPPSTAHNL